VNIRRGIVANCCERLASDGTEAVQNVRQFVTIPYYGEFLSALDTGREVSRWLSGTQRVCRYTFCVVWCQSRNLLFANS
jgi:hypothetical protein